MVVNQKHWDRGTIIQGCYKWHIGKMHTRYLVQKKERNPPNRLPINPILPYPKILGATPSKFIQNNHIYVNTHASEFLNEKVVDELIPWSFIWCIMLRVHCSATRHQTPSPLGYIWLCQFSRRTNFACWGVSPVEEKLSQLNVFRH